MNQSISGRVVKVDRVKSCGGGGGGGRSNFGRERECYYHHNDERNGDWERGRDRDIRDQDYDHGNEKDEYRTRHGDRSRDRDRSQDRDRSRDHNKGRDKRVEHVQDYDDQGRENMLDDYWNRDDGGVIDREHSLDVDADRKMDRVSDPDKSFDEPKREPSRRNIDLNVINENSPSDSTDDHNDEAEDELKQSMEELDKLKKEVLNNNDGSKNDALEVRLFSRYTFKSGVYSFGITVLELISSRKLFDR